MWVTLLERKINVMITIDDAEYSQPNHIRYFGWLCEFLEFIFFSKASCEN